MATKISQSEWTKWKKTISVFHSSITSQWWWSPKCIITTNGWPRNTGHIWPTKCERTWESTIQKITRSTRTTLLHQKNIPFERSIFRAAKLLEKEPIEQCISQLRQLGQYCEYGNEIENNMRDKIISSCLSSKLVKQVLTEPDLTLTS